MKLYRKYLKATKKEVCLLSIYKQAFILKWANHLTFICRYVKDLVYRKPNEENLRQLYQLCSKM